MDRYYQTLELPLTATQEEIKNQYKQLVRLYHPDRFLAAQDKSLAEEKLKGINEAYDYLTNHLVTAFPVRFSAAALDLVITPTILDFGTLAPNRVANCTFQVRFNQGIAENADFICSEEDSWFKVVRVSHLYGADYSTLEFDVQVDTNDLAPQTYQGWIDVYLNGSLARVPLSLEVTPALRWRRSSLLVVTSGVAIVILLVGVLAFTRSNSLTQPPIAMPAIQIKQQSPAPELSFALLENEQLAIYSLLVGEGGVNRGAPKGLGVNSRSAVGSVRSQLVAYLGEDGEVYLLALATRKSRVVTSDGEPKAALSWSADGERLAYLVGEGKQSRIAVYEVAREVVTELPGEVTGGVSHYAWSPDGTMLLFDLWQGKERRVYRIGVDGSGLQPLTRFDSWGGTWSADGRSVVVSSARGLYRLDSQGRTVTQVSKVVGESPSWSVDGKWLAYLTQEETSAGQQLWLLEVASGATTLVATESVSYAWSPVGALLGYVTGRATGVTPLLYLWTVLPGEQSQLVAEVNDPLFHWTK